MGSLRHDLSLALRTLWHSPGFTVLSVLILSFEIGANAAIFSILNALVLREVPAPRPDRLVQLTGIYRNGSNVPLTFPMFRELQRGQRVFSGLFGWSGLLDSTVDSSGMLFRAGIRAVTGTYFSELGAAPQLGRLLAPEDDAPGAPSRVAVLGYQFWERRFGGDPGVVGHVIRIDGRPFIIIGVTRPWFIGMNPGEAPDLIIPAVASPFDLENRAALWVFATGRLRDGVGLGQARAQLASFWPALLQATVPTHIPGPRLQSFLSMRLNAEPTATGVSVALRARFARLWIVMAIAALILIIVCVNLASLMLVRASARTQEVSIRIALGAGARDIMRQFVTESLLVSCAWRIHKITRQSVSDKARDSASASDTRQSLSATQVRQNQALGLLTPRASGAH